MKIRSWDKVKVITWKDKGTEAKVLKVFKQSGKILVEWVNVVTRHIKKMGTNPGQIIKMEKAIDASNVMLVCPHTNLPTRVWFVLVEEKGNTKKFRYSKKAVKEQNKQPKDVIIK